MTVNLERRFKNFIMTLRGAEDLDSNTFAFASGTSKADYLLYDRTVVVELKNMTADPRSKIDSRIDDHLENTGGVIYGKVLSTQLFDNQLESDSFHKSLIYALTRNTEAACKQANKQLATTRAVLGLNATSLLVILNENIETLDPGIVGYRVAQYLNEEPRDIDFCLLIFESHKIKGDSSLLNSVMCIAGRNPTHRSRRRINAIMESWAAFNGLPYIRSTVIEPESLQYVPSSGP